MTGVGFGPDNLYRSNAEDSPIPGGNILLNIGDVNPLDILFEGDEEEDDEKSEFEEKKNSFVSKYSNGFGGERNTPNFNDFESRFDFNDRKIDEDNVRSLSNEMTSQGEISAGLGGDRTFSTDRGGGTGSRRERRAEKFGGRSREEEEGDSQLISNMIRAISESQDNYDGDMLNSIQSKGGYVVDEMDAIYNRVEVVEEREEEGQEEGEGEDVVYVEEEVVKKEDEDIDGDYSLIGDD